MLHKEVKKKKRGGEDNETEECVSKRKSCLETLDTTAGARFNSSPLKELAALLTINTRAHERQVDGGAVSPDNSRGAVLPFLVARRCLAPTDWPEQFAFPSGCSKKYAMK